MSAAIDNVAAHQQRTAGLWRSRAVGTYFVVLGALHVIALGFVLSRNEALALSLAPWWFYALGLIYPVSRFAAGISLLSRSHLAVPILGLLATCAGVALFGGSAIWKSQTGMPLEMFPVYVVFARLDFLLILVTLIASFRWKARGLLK